MHVHVNDQQLDRLNHHDFRVNFQSFILLHKVLKDLLKEVESTNTIRHDLQLALHVVVLEYLSHQLLVQDLPLHVDCCTLHLIEVHSLGLYLAYGV